MIAIHVTQRGIQSVQVLVNSGAFDALDLALLPIVSEHLEKLDRRLGIAQLLSDRIFENFPNRTAPTEKQLLTWAWDIERLHRIDGHAYVEIRELAVWAQADPFWKANIL